MVRSALVVLAGLLVAGGAAAQDIVGSAAAGTERFWVQDSPMSALVSSDIVAQDRRFAGGLGYGLNLVPPAGPQGLNFGAGAPDGPLALDNWHFGVDLLQPYGAGKAGSVAQFAMNVGGRIGGSWALSVGPTVSLGGDGTGSLFSPSYGSGGMMRRLQGDTGLQDYGLRGSAVYSLGDSWALTGVLGYRRSLGELGVSTPDEQFFSVLGLGYRF
jgi:hypothetical protein